MGKTKFKHQVHSEERFDDIGASLEHTLENPLDALCWKQIISKSVQTATNS
jgi:hypothetical protein